MNVGDRVFEKDQPQYVGKILKIERSRALVQWHKGYRTWCLLSDLEIARGEVLSR